MKSQAPAPSHHIEPGIIHRISEHQEVRLQLYPISNLRALALERALELIMTNVSAIIFQIPILGCIIRSHHRGTSV